LVWFNSDHEIQTLIPVETSIATALAISVAPLHATSPIPANARDDAPRVAHHACGRGTG
jgi:hypothetical protein